VIVLCINHQCMNKSLFCLAILLLTLNLAAQDNDRDHRGLRLSFYSGYGNQDFRWSIAGNYAGGNPNILSELKWKDVKGPIAGTRVDLSLGHRWSASVDANVSITTSGCVTDADYSGDDRTGRTYYVAFASDRGEGFRISAQPAYSLINKGFIRLLAAAGYQYGSMHLRIRENGEEDPSVIATGLNSSYNTRMHGPKAAMVLHLRLAQKLSLAFMPGASFLQYSARANWNLATDLKHPLSFEHRANGWEWTGRLELSYGINKNLNVFTTLDYRRLQINGGDDILYRSDGQILRSHFNGASGNTLNALAGVKFNINKIK